MRTKTVCLCILSIVLCVNGGDNDIQDEHSLELTQSLNLARQELISEKCRRLPPKYTLNDLAPSLLEHILVDEEHKLLYCYVPKVACTNWKRILMIISGKWNDTDVLSIPASLAHTPGMFRNLSTVEPTERDYMLENYHKMIVVRNPFERLLSAYRNKFEGDLPSARYFQDRVGRRIIKAFRENPTNKSLELGHDVTFKEFAQFLTNRSAELADIVNNEHWQPITSLCHPCLIKYSLVGVSGLTTNLVLCWKNTNVSCLNEGLHHGEYDSPSVLAKTRNARNGNHTHPDEVPRVVLPTPDLGKYETLLDDSLLALHTINESHVQFPRLTKTSGTSQKLHKYFSQLDLPLIRKLYKLYKYDYRLFNYDLDNIVGFDLG